MKHLTSQHYSELLSQIEKLREERDMFKRNCQKESARADKEKLRADKEKLRADKEKLRANALQKDLDAIDDFNALVESEISRSLNHRKPS